MVPPTRVGQRRFLCTPRSAAAQSLAARCSGACESVIQLFKGRGVLKLTNFGETKPTVCCRPEHRRQLEEEIGLQVGRAEKRFVSLCRATKPTSMYHRAPF